MLGELTVCEGEKAPLNAAMESQFILEFVNAFLILKELAKQNSKLLRGTHLPSIKSWFRLKASLVGATQQ